MKKTTWKESSNKEGEQEKEFDRLLEAEAKLKQSSISY